MEKESISSFCFFLLSGEPPRAVLGMWAQSDSAAGWKKDLHPTHPLYRSAEKALTPSLSSSRTIVSNGQLWINKPWAASGEFTIVCVDHSEPNTVHFAGITAARGLSVQRRFDFVFSSHLWSENTSLLKSWAVTSTSPASFLRGTTESHRTGKRIPHPNAAIPTLWHQRILMHAHAFPPDSAPQPSKQSASRSTSARWWRFSSDAVLQAILNCCCRSTKIYCLNETLHLELMATEWAAHTKKVPEYSSSNLNEELFSVFSLGALMTGEVVAVVYKSLSAARCSIKPIWKGLIVDLHCTRTAASSSVWQRSANSSRCNEDRVKAYDPVTGRVYVIKLPYGV